MSRTATCFFALGICVAMAAACGDDDGGDGGGGSGGMGASGGSGGSSGGGGSGGSAGAPSGGSAGQPGGGAGGTPGGSGSGGTSGSAGSSAGSAGTGTVVPFDAGPDGSVESDASTEPVPPADSGVNGDCVGFADPPTGDDAQTGQDVVISRVLFNDDDQTATVVLRVINPFALGGEHRICWGASNSECAFADDGVDGGDAGSAERPAGTDVSIVVGTPADPIDVDAGELFYASNVPEEAGTPSGVIVFAYVNWGDHDSADVPAAGVGETLETLAVAADRWTLGDSITLDANDNAFSGSGDTISDNGFAGCTADQL